MRKGVIDYLYNMYNKLHNAVLLKLTENRNLHLMKYLWLRSACASLQSGNCFGSILLPQSKNSASLGKVQANFNFYCVHKGNSHRRRKV